MGGNAISRASQTKRAIGSRLAIIARHMRTAYDQRVETIGVTGAKWRVIAVVSHTPGITQRGIATTLGITEVTAGRLVDRLCDAGYMERRADPRDRRAYRIYLTKSAGPLMKQLKQIATICENEAFASLKPDELENLNLYLEKIARNLSNARGAKETRSTRASAK